MVESIFIKRTCLSFFPHPLPPPPKKLPFINQGFLCIGSKALVNPGKKGRSVSWGSALLKNNYFDFKISLNHHFHQKNHILVNSFKNSLCLWERNKVTIVCGFFWQTLPSFSFFCHLSWSFPKSGTALVFFFSPCTYWGILLQTQNSKR